MIIGKTKSVHFVSKDAPKAWIFTGGDCFPALLSQLPAAGDLILAADVGLKTLTELKLRPNILLGDFDSLGEPPELPGAEILRVPCEKDDTDTQMAVRIALERGAGEIVIVGGLGGRLDHTLSNLAILEDLDAKKIPARITTGKTDVLFLKNNSILLTRQAKFKYLSLICADEKLTGVTMKGVKYPLENAVLYRKNQYTVSNEWSENAALIAIRHGGGWILEESNGI